MPGRSTRRLRRELGFTVLGISRQLRCPKVSKGRAESSFVRPQAHTACPRVKHDAPTTARTVGLPPRWGQYFLSKRKKVPKKARGTALREKGFYCPFCRRGSQCRAQWSWIVFTSSWSALLCSPFSAVKMGGPFSLRCLSPLCSPATGAGQTQPVPLGMVRRSLDIFAMQKASGISYPRWPFQRAMRPVAEWRSFLLN